MYVMMCVVVGKYVYMLWLLFIMNYRLIYFWIFGEIIEMKLMKIVKKSCLNFLDWEIDSCKKFNFFWKMLKRNLDYKGCKDYFWKGYWVLGLKVLFFLVLMIEYV